MDAYDQLCEECKEKLAKNRHRSDRCNQIIFDYCDRAAASGMDADRFMAQKSAYLEQLLDD